MNTTEQTETQDTDRLWAAAKSFRRDGKREQLDALTKQVNRLRKREIKAHEKRLEILDQLIRFANSEPVRFKDGFKLEPPEGYWAEAYMDGDGIHVYYVNDDGGIIDMEWMFTSDYVWAEDLKALGFKVEY